MDLSALRFCNSADVYKNGQIAGTLNRDFNGAVSFSYQKNYSGLPVASTLPIQEEDFTAEGGGLPPFFSGLLPEGHRLSVLKNSVKTSFDDEFSLLLAVGQDTPGDIQVVPHNEPPQAATPLVQFESDTIDFRSITHSVDGVSIPGVQNKASASMINTPIKTGNNHAILKLDPPEHPHLVHNEYLHLIHAK